MGMCACYMANPSNQLAQGLLLSLPSEVGFTGYMPTQNLHGFYMPFKRQAQSPLSQLPRDLFRVFLTFHVSDSLKSMSVHLKKLGLSSVCKLYLSRKAICFHSMKTFLEGPVVQSEDRLVDGALGMMAWMHKSADGNTDE